MNPLNRLLGHLKTDDRELTPEELEAEAAEAKKARIKYHRDNVRNGPVKYRSITTGMQRRAAERAQDSQARKTNRRYRRAWMAQRAEIATLRGHLIILGVVECKGDTVFTPEQIRESSVWVIRKYGTRDEETGELVQHDNLLAESVGKAREAFLQFHGAQERQAASV